MSACDNEESLPRARARDRAATGDTVREMDAADWASLSDEELLERRISKLGLRLEGTPLETEKRKWKLASGNSSSHLRSMHWRNFFVTAIAAVAVLGWNQQARTAPDDLA